MKKIYLFILLVSLLTACGGKRKQNTENKDSETTEISNSVNQTAGKLLNILDQTKLPQKIDLDQDVDKMSYQELRIWLHYVYASRGLHIMEADLNSFFKVNTDWYEKLIWNSWEEDRMFDKYSDIKLSEEEQAFVDNINKRIEDLKKDITYSKEIIS